MRGRSRRSRRFRRITVSRFRRWLGALTGTHIFRSLPRGMDLAADLSRWLPEFKPQIVFDVGAHRGQSTERFLRWFPAARVFAFEPVSRTYAELVRRYQSEQRVRTEQCAFGRTEGVAMMRIEGDSDRYAIDSGGTAGSGPTEQVKVETVDRFAAREAITRIGLLKIDTEGHDLAVLQGAESLLACGAIDLVQVEAGWHEENHRHVPAEQLKSYLEGRGFRLFGIYDQKEEWTTGDSWLRRADLVFVRRAGG